MGLKHGDRVCYQARNGHKFGKVERDDVGVVIAEGELLTVLWADADANADTVLPNGERPLEFGYENEWRVFRINGRLSPADVDAYIADWHRRVAALDP